jgi:alkaline phosphatase D
VAGHGLRAGERRLLLRARADLRRVAQEGSHRARGGGRRQALVLGGLTSADLPPRAYDPVGVEFVTGSISAQGLVEIGDRIVKPDHALRALYYTGEHREIPAINYTLLHGVRAALALSQTSAAEARKLHNPAVAPHLKFVDLGGHGYGLVTVTADWLRDGVRLHPGAV